MDNPFKIHFLGASGTVTGSRFLLETPGLNILIDCGMFQGEEELQELNREIPQFPPKDINLVLLTHGHLDHCGYLPRLVSLGFKGEVSATLPTLAIAEIIMFDSARIQEEDADRALEENTTSIASEPPLYTIEDVEEAVSLFHHRDLDKWQEVSKEIRYRFKSNGHILGATFIELEVYGKTLVFSGDIGRKADLLLFPPERPKRADYLFLESTYGDRNHPQEDAPEILASLFHEASSSDGTLIIPSFAVERLQTLMYIIWKLHQEKRIPEIPVFIDSPMGNAVWDVFKRFTSWHKLSREELHAMERYFTMITSYKDTWKTIDNPKAKVVIAGSGMVTGGRVLTYLRYYLELRNTLVVLVGFQAEGTRGRELQEGAEEIRIFGKICPVNAKVICIHSLSAHADQNELISWVSSIENDPTQVFLIHGEQNARRALKERLELLRGWSVHLPERGEQIDLDLSSE